MLELKRYTGSLVTPRDDALLYDFLINDTGVFEGLTVTHLGANQLLISAGRGIIKGRDFTAEEETILAQLSDSGEKKGRLLVRVDMSNEAAPIQFVTQVAASLPALVQEDINRGGTVYELPIAQYDVDELQISNLTYVAKTVLPQGGVYPATCTYSSGVFTLSGLPDNLPDIFTVRFKAPADFAEGDTLSINALPYALFMPNQQPAQAGAFAQNAVVSLNIDLATGKAFLAGGGGGVGMWEELTLSGTGLNKTPSIWVNKKLELMSCSQEVEFVVTGIGPRTYTIQNPPFVVSDSPLSLTLQTTAGRGMNGAGDRSVYCFPTAILIINTSQISLRFVQHESSVGVCYYMDGDGSLKMHSVSDIKNVVFRLNFVVRIPSQNWL